MEGKEISGKCLCPICGFYKISIGRLGEKGIVEIIGEYKRQWKSIEDTNGNKKWAFCGKDGWTDLKTEEEWNKDNIWSCGNWACGYNSETFLVFIDIIQKQMNKKQ